MHPKTKEIQPPPLARGTATRAHASETLRSPTGAPSASSASNRNPEKSKPHPWRFEPAPWRSEPAPQELRSASPTAPCGAQNSRMLPTRRPDKRIDPNRKLDIANPELDIANPELDIANRNLILGCFLNPAKREPSNYTILYYTIT